MEFSPSSESSSHPKQEAIHETVLPDIFQLTQLQYLTLFTHLCFITLVIYLIIHFKCLIKNFFVNIQLCLPSSIFLLSCGVSFFCHCNKFPEKNNFKRGNLYFDGSQSIIALVSCSIVRCSPKTGEDMEKQNYSLHSSEDVERRGTGRKSWGQT